MRNFFWKTDMSLLLSSLRSHFCKHLTYTTFFAVRHSHNLDPATTSALTQFSDLSYSRLYELRKQCNFRRPNSITAKFSTSFSSETPSITSSESSYLSVHILCHKDVSDMLSEALLCFGASSTSTNEEDNNEPNDEICLSSIFTECQDVDKCISLAADSIGLKNIPSYEIIKHDHSDWIKETQESFHPLEVTEGLWIVPEWKTPPPDLQATNIILNPGLAFGTGEHPTTKLCLLLLHGLIKGGELFLDYGTGSGILAIAALKFGAALSVGFDIDPQAITSAQHNAALNNIGPDKLQLHLVPSNANAPFADEMLNKGVEGKNLYNTETEKYDVVIANILLNPLLDLADQIVSYAKPGALVGLSGIKSDQLPRIIQHYSQFLEDITVSKMDDWACVSGSKKRNLSGI